MKPTFDIGTGTYFGGKGAAGVVHTIINQIPKHDVFVSGFLGRCAIMRWKRPASYNVGIDLDPAVIAEWREAGLKNIHLVNDSFLDWVVPLNAGEKGFCYLDPPYLLETRTSSNRYQFELTHEQHLQLLDKACRIPYMVAISCYDSALYSRKLKGWRKIQFQSQTRGGTRTETLYMNYPEPSPNQLHDPRFLGANFRDRERGKRRINTIKGKIERLEPLEMARLSEWLKHLVASQG